MHVHAMHVYAMYMPCMHMSCPCSPDIGKGGAGGGLALKGVWRAILQAANEALSSSQHSWENRCTHGPFVFSRVFESKRNASSTF